MHDPTDAVPPEVRPFPRSADEASAERVMDGIIRLRLPLPYSPSAMVNAFLLERAGGGWCLVDCGTSIAPGWSALERALDLAGVETSAIELLVCTHAHADHYGLASEVMERSGCPLALAAGPTASAEVLRDTIVPLEHRLALAQRAGVPRELSLAAVSHPGDDGLHPRPAPDLVLDEGLEIETLAGRWRVVPAPGHSPTQVMLFDDRSRMLLSADLVLAPPIPYAEHDYTPDPWAEHVASLERARALRPDPAPAGARSAQRGSRREDRESPRRHGCRRRACPRPDCNGAAEHLGDRRRDPRARRAVLPAPGSALRGHLPARAPRSHAARRRRRTGATACAGSKRSSNGRSFEIGPLSR